MTSQRQVHFVVLAGRGQGVHTHIAERGAESTLCGLQAGARGGGVFELNGCRKCRTRALADGVTHVIEFDDSRATIDEKGFWDQ
jgi:hypothetical protein